MVIYAKYKNKKWEVDEDTCNYFPFFREVLQKYGAKAMAFVILVADPTSPFAYIESESEKIQEVYLSVFGKEKFNVEQLKNAVHKYTDMCNTQEYKLRKSYLNGGKLLSDYINNEKKIDSENLKDIIIIMKELPNVITQTSEINKSADMSAKDNIGKVKSNRKLSWNEEKLR